MPTSSRSMPNAAAWILLGVQPTQIGLQPDLKSMPRGTQLPAGPGAGWCRAHIPGMALCPHCVPASWLPLFAWHWQCSPHVCVQSEGAPSLWVSAPAVVQGPCCCAHLDALLAHRLPHSLPTAVLTLSALCCPRAAGTAPWELAKWCSRTARMRSRRWLPTTASSLTTVLCS